MNDFWEKKRSLKEKYDSSAEHYNDRYEDIQRRKFRAVEKELDDVKRILDVGCGTCLFIREFSSFADFVVGVDLSLSMLRKAKAHGANSPLISADADNLPFARDTFGVVVSLTLLQNMPEPIQTLKEMARVTREGGKVITTVLKKKYSVDEVADLLISAGLKPNKVERISESEDVLGVGEK